MKTKLFMTALALPLAFAACTNEDDFGMSPAAQGETLTVAVTRGGYGVDTKAAWTDEEEGAAFEWTTVSDDKIGMALLNPSDASKVLTNYEMSLIGWYNANGEGSDATYNTTAQNGVKYTTTKPTDGNAGAGVFQATGLTVMDGNYVVYHPYDADFAKAGYLAVDFRTKQTAESTTTATATTVADAQKKMLEAAGENAFSYSQPTVIEKGGQVASDFATTNLSALVKLALTKFDANTKIKKIILLEDAANFNKNSNGFLKSAHLNAEKIKTQSGVNVLESPVYTSMVELAFTGETNSTPGLDMSTEGAANFYMVAGPRTSTNAYSILLINDQNLASIWTTNVKFEAGKKATINIKHNGNHPFETLIVTNGQDLKEILEKTDGSYDNKTINLLGDIVVEDLGTIGAKNVTLEAYGDNAETSLKLVAKSANVTVASASGDDKGLKFEIPVTVESKDQYTVTLDGKVSFSNLTNNGAMIVRGSNVAINKMTNNNSLTLARASVLVTSGNVVNKGLIKVNGATTSPSVQTGATWNIGEGTTLTNEGEINNYFTINNFGTIDNSKGTYVQKLEGKFIGQNDIDADKQGNYVVEVANDDQFTYANEETSCTTIRVVNATIGADDAATTEEVEAILKDLTIFKKVELTGTSAKLVLNNTELNGGLYVINDNTAATIEGTAYASTIVINAASAMGMTAPKLTVEANSIITAGSIVNNGTGSIKEGSTGIPASVKTLSSTGAGTWDNYPQVVSEL